MTETEEIDWKELQLTGYLDVAIDDATKRNQELRSGVSNGDYNAIGKSLDERIADARRKLGLPEHSSDDGSGDDELRSKVETEIPG